jgi:hypothetical protein
MLFATQLSYRGGLCSALNQGPLLRKALRNVGDLERVTDGKGRDFRATAGP